MPLRFYSQVAFEVLSMFLAMTQWGCVCCAVCAFVFVAIVIVFQCSRAPFVHAKSHNERERFFTVRMHFPRPFIYIKWCSSLVRLLGCGKRFACQSACERITSTRRDWHN